MPSTNIIVYTPRTDKEVYEELKTKQLPIELKEQLQLVDSPPEIIEQKIASIIQRILETNKLSNSIRIPQILLSGSDNENASMITMGKQPIIIITKGLLKNIQSEDELAGVIAHEIGHLLLYKQHKEVDHHNKIEETAADNLGVNLLHKAGYDPNSVIYFLRRVGGDEGHLITIDDITNSNSLEKAANLAQALTDPHPSEESRIRAMTTYITSLKREGTITDIPKLTLLDQTFKEAADRITYDTPIAKALKDGGYEGLSTVEKLTVLTNLLNAVYLPTNKTSAERLSEISIYINKLTVNFDEADQAEAFKCLADVFMVDTLHKSDNPIVFPKNCHSGDSIDRDIKSALENVWKKGGKNPKYLARNEDLKNVLELFFYAKTKDEAEKYAAEIVILCEKISPTHRSRDFKGFLPPNIEEVQTSIKTYGKWHPPYSKHVLWCIEENSENIKKVLCGMDLHSDPWVANILGPVNNFWNYRLYIEGRNAHSYLGDYKLFAQLERNKDGVATGELLEIPCYQWKCYQWKKFPHDTPLQTLERYHRDEAENQRKYEEKIVSTVDWQLLKTDFPRFILQYGQLINHYYSIVPITSPFAQRFFEELTAFLPVADEDYKLQLKDFFRDYKIDEDIPSHRTTIQRFYDLYPKDNAWPYSSVPRPNYRHLNEPFIKFVLNPLSSTVITDGNKLYTLKNTADFLQSDPNKKLNEIFPISPRSILAHYPQDIKTVADLDAAKKAKSGVQSITLTLEAERLAYEYENTLSMQEFVILDKTRAYLAFDKEYVSNIDTFFTQLRHKTAQRYLNIEDCAELIRNYRYAVAHNMLLDAPSIRNDAYSKIKNLLPKLPALEQIEHLNALFKPEVITPGEETSYYDLDKKYDGYIADPEFRNWAIEQLTDLLANQLGLDNGTPDYLERIRPVIDDIAKQTVGVTQLNILSNLATKVNAQKDVAYLIRDTYNTNSVVNALSKRYEGIAIELIINESNKDPLLRQHILDFLANPLTHSSPKPLRNYLLSKYKFELRELSGDIIDDQLRNYYKNFRASSLTMRTVYLEPLLFPLKSTDGEQLGIIKKLIDDAFPITPNTLFNQSLNNENQYARLIINEYLGVVELPERRLLATALFIATMQEEHSVKRTIGQKLNMVLSHMGPAGGKLLQAIHSHPQTPEDIKKDLASSKTLFDPPLRWELVEYIDKSGLLETSENNPHPVTNIGKLVGSGSFGLTVFNTLSDQTKVADTFLREHAAIKAERELNLMSDAATKIVTSKPELQPIINMVEEAKRSARDETNMKLAENANLIAVKSYNNTRVLVGEYDFTHGVTTLQKTGENFKRVTIADGEHFNDLPNSPYKTALAKAMVAMQITLRLAGSNTDLDRHGGNIKIKENTISHFDFGAMNVTPITKEDKVITGRILAKTLIAVLKGGEFSKALLTNIQNAQVSDASRIYLNGLNKDFLALGDYLHIIDKNELINFMAKCLIAKTVDHQIKDAFKEELGFFYSYLIMGLLQYKAEDADVEIFLDGDFAQLEQTKETLKNKVLRQRAEHLIRFSHPETAPSNTLTEADVSRIDNKFLQVIKKIEELDNYGHELKKAGKNRGDKAINLAINLRSELYSYINETAKKEETTLKIHALMQQGKLIMREDRRALDILAHILIALTGVGLAFMLKQKQQTGTFFLNKTKREVLLSNVEEEMDNTDTATKGRQQLQ